MTLLDRYIIKAHFGPFLFGFFTVVFIFLMQFLLNYLELLLGKGLEPIVIAQFIVYNLSWMIVWGMPMGVLFSTLMTFGSLSANYESTIMKASGLSLFRMILPILIMGLLISYFLFWYNDKILPVSNHKAKTLMSDIRKKKPTFALQSGQFSNDLNGLSILPRKVDSISGAMNGLTIYDYSRYNVLNVVSADSGAIGFTNDSETMLLKLYKGEIHQISKLSQKNNRIIDFKEYVIKMRVDGYGFSRSGDDPMSRGQREMSIKELSEIRDNSLKNAEMVQTQTDKKFIEDFKARVLPSSFKVRGIKERGAKEVADAIDRELQLVQSNARNEIEIVKDNLKNAREYEAEIQKKYSIPFACFIFVLVGCPLGIKTKGGNFGLSAAISLGFYVVYWACLIGGETLADRGFLSPVISMWLADIILGTVGIVLCIDANYENFTFKSLLKFKAK